MAQFLYYAPAARLWNHDDVRAAGLGYVFDRPPSMRYCDTGPDSGGGMLFSSSDQRLAFKAGDAQQWKQIPQSAIWCGVWFDDRPKPQDLQRQSIISGEWITDDNGDAWCAPKARRFEVIDDDLAWRHNLPTQLRLDERGQWITGDVKPRFRRLWDLAMRYEALYLEAAEQATGRESSVTIEFAEASELVFRALQVNYRIAEVEFDLLGIYDMSFCVAVLDALIDKRRREEFWKKKLESATALADATSTASASGPPASTPGVPTDTSQHSPT